jgi:ABC-2 type transport system ATP-binding protein
VRLIELKDVDKYFDSSLTLKNVNLTIEKNDLLGIVGSSGSGKTTLLNLIAGFIRPTKGEISYYSGQTQRKYDLHKDFKTIKKHLGYASQHNSFYPELTVKENILHFGKMYNLPEKLLIDNAINLLKVTHLYEERNKLASKLSGGMQRRLDIICSLVHKPKILILDEPAADLDPQLKDEMYQFIKTINEQEVTIILASHDLDKVEKICNKIAFIKEKEIFLNDEIVEIRKKYLKDNFTINLHLPHNKEEIVEMVRNLPVKSIIDKGNFLTIEPENFGVSLSKILHFIEENNLKMHDIDIRQPSLNEIFKEIQK